jgi:glycosyltransferase involved in cell wall biosynthesis
MSVHLNFVGHFNSTGVGRHSENAFFALSRNRPEGVAVEYCNCTREESIQRLLATARAATDVSVFFWRLPVEFVQRVPGRRVLWWFFESDRLPRKWLEDIQVYDRIWAPSPWARDVLLDHGLAAGRVQVVESGVNTRVFTPAAVAHAGFVFLQVGKYERRKSQDETIAAFSAEFPPGAYPHVQLWLKADFPIFPERREDLVRKVAHDARIRVLSGELSDEEMARIYNQADAFVFPSKAEGFGLPCLEALACGLPVIATSVSAQSVFLEPVAGRFIPVETERGPIVDPDYERFYAAEYRGEAFGQWALPSIDSLRRGMREVYENLPAWKLKAAEAARVVADGFSWDVIAARALTALRELGGLG